MPAAKGNNYAAGNKGGGRKSTFKKEYVHWAEKMARLGATDVDLADALGVTEKTVNEWKKIHQEFGFALKRGKMLSDAEVANRLYERAMGYSHPEDKIFNNNGEALIVPTTKHYPPDTTAAIFWLKNRCPAQWRDRVEDQKDTGNLAEALNKLADKLPD